MERPAGSNPLHRHLIWLFDTAATEAEALTCFSFPEHLSLSPRSGLTWSSDGTGIYFLGVEEADSPKTAIWFLSVPGGSARKVLDEPENSRFASLCAAPPAPGGTAVPRQVLALLLLPKRGTESAANVCLLLPEDDRFRSLVPTVLLPQELRIDYTSSISWDGACRRLAYVRDRDIWLIELATPSEAATLDCQDNLAALYKAFTQYAGQHGGLLPSPEQDTEGKWRQGDFFWVDALAPFIEQQSVLECSSRETLPSSYSFNRDLWGKSLADVSATRDVPLLTETQPSHGGRRNVLTPDGQIRLQAG
jgi:hypothetical protein